MASSSAKISTDLIDVYFKGLNSSNNIYNNRHFSRHAVERILERNMDIEQIVTTIARYIDDHLCELIYECARQDWRAVKIECSNLIARGIFDAAQNRFIILTVYKRGTATWLTK